MTSLKLLTSKYLSTNIKTIVSTKNFILLIDFLVVFPGHFTGIAQGKMACPDLMENIESIFNDIFSADIKKVAKVSKLIMSALRARSILKNELRQYLTQITYKILQYLFLQIVWRARSS